MAPTWRVEFPDAMIMESAMLDLPWRSMTTTLSALSSSSEDLIRETRFCAESPNRLLFVMDHLRPLTRARRMAVAESGFSRPDTNTQAGGRCSASRRADLSGNRNLPNRRAAFMAKALTE
jgi:hypothetical protein